MFPVPTIIELMKTSVPFRHRDGISSVHSVVSDEGKDEKEELCISVPCPQKKCSREFENPKVVRSLNVKKEVNLIWVVLKAS